MNDVIDYKTVRDKWMKREYDFMALTSKRANMLTKLDEWYKQEGKVSYIDAIMGEIL